MDDDFEQAKDYFFDAIQRVGTFAFGEQLSYIMMADAYHRARGIRGAVGEIGVFLGDYLFGLGVCARPDERIVAIDLFEDQDANIDGSGRHDKTIEYFKDLHRRYIRNEASIEFIKRDSLYLTPGDLLAKSGQQEYRIFSIDGGHTHYHLTNDLLLVEAVLEHGGVVIIDDYTNAGWPGVAEGVARYFLLSPRRTLAPFLTHWNKLLVTTESKHAEVLAFYEDYAHKHNFNVVKQRLFGFDVIHTQGFSQTLFL
jgi:hypothetical protein